MKAIFLTAIAFAVPFGLHAQEDESARLRDALKNLTLQLRTAQGETATAQAASIAAEQKAKGLETKITDLEKRNESLAKQSNEDRTSSEKTIASLNNRLAEREKRLAEYIAALDKWKAGYEAAAGAARTKDAESAKLAQEAIVLKRTIADRERKNIALFNLSNEILTRYQDYSLGKSLAAKEPFVGKARVQAENLVQGYQDKILDNRLSAPASKP